MEVGDWIWAKRGEKGVRSRLYGAQQGVFVYSIMFIKSIPSQPQDTKGWRIYYFL